MGCVVVAQFALGYLTFRAASKAAKHAHCVHVGDLPELRASLNRQAVRADLLTDEVRAVLAIAPKSRKRTKAVASPAAQ
jgi:hypothetical protein